MTEWKDRARELADDLDAKGVLGAAWRPVFEAVPRHAFTPVVYRDPDGSDIVRGDDPAQHSDWLEMVYSDQTLLTQRSPAPGFPDLVLPTSSSTMPSLMARMLDLLDLQPGQRVLEIGTGTGYNAALLCGRVGDDLVASIDIDPELVQAAGGRLAELGLWPTLAVGDGADGLARSSPFDRILATCAVQRVPASWVGQLTPGGRIVADLRNELGGSLIALDRQPGGEVTGRFLGVPGHFMWLRARADNPLRFANQFTTEVELGDLIESSTAIDPVVLERPDAQFWLGWREPSIEGVWRTTRDDREIMELDGGQYRAFVSIEPTTDGRYAVSQPEHIGIWDRAEATLAEWTVLGEPPPERFGLTVDVDGRHALWLDDPDGDQRWILSGPRA